ncbi:response regulator [Pseudooceanicola spongiae]|jgi:two-component system, OmpR family, KDP operon response regulator KdpE|uniref:Response regulator n=1 Tax=Pseudooceanicola spongiae TaxID=2613965 RepID=A0A7L9WNT7_9RHOB|nr:response regulator transcription factor [Pseudooceanicola spongiae]QOL80760.1 response regulator [Pseudooceanicola spongiae]
MTRTKPRILVVEDELAIRRLVQAALTRGGYDSDIAETGAAGLRKAAGCDLALLDLGLPDRDGLELIGPLRDAGLSVIILTAREQTEEKVAALDLGADDYVTKPFDTDELLARVRSCLRRRAAQSGVSGKIATGALRIDLDAHSVTRDGVPVKLTPKEFALLELLAGNAGKVLTHAHLLGTVWGPAHVESVEYLRVAIRSLRAKLEKDPGDPRLLINEPGVGYRLVDQE